LGKAEPESGKTEPE
jgi:hypothetical protein